MSVKDIKSFVKKHISILAGIILGCFGGLWGIFAGVLAGGFIELLLNRRREDIDLMKSFENPASVRDNQIPEPFDGAFFIAGLTMFCVGNPAVAAENLRHFFGCTTDDCLASETGCKNEKRFSLSKSLQDERIIDWETICRAAGNTESLNADLLAECLAAKLKKNAPDAFIEKLFKLFSAVEYGWNHDRGEKPSEYLSRLLDYTPEKGELESAYMLLGLPTGASLREVKKAHRKLASFYHPDTTKTLSPEQKKTCDDMFIRIQKAYDFICENAG